MLTLDAVKLHGWNIEVLILMLAWWLLLGFLIGTLFLLGVYRFRSQRLELTLLTYRLALLALGIWRTFTNYVITLTAPDLSFLLLLLSFGLIK